jgi:type II secretion system protein G
MEKNIARGFTLIELLVVISIIAVLTAIATVSYTNVQKKSRDGKRKADIRAIQQALAVFHQDKGRYPPTFLAMNDEEVGWCAIINDPNHAGIDGVSAVLVPTYIKQLPHDPVHNGVPGDYFFRKTAKGHYQLGTVLENANDPDKSSGFPFDNGTFGATWGVCEFTASDYPNYYVVSDQ